jgi:hypothetical protein
MPIFFDLVLVIAEALPLARISAASLLCFSMNSSKSSEVSFFDDAAPLKRVFAFASAEACCAITRPIGGRAFWYPFPPPPWW